MIFKGKDALIVPYGTLLRVLTIPSNSLTIPGTIIMRLDGHNIPFIDLPEGRFWGNHIKDYSFRLIKTNYITNKQNIEKLDAQLIWLIYQMQNGLQGNG